MDPSCFYRWSCGYECCCGCTEREELPENGIYYGGYNAKGESVEVNE